jgi:hypothetical protein
MEKCHIYTYTYIYIYIYIYMCNVLTIIVYKNKLELLGHICNQVTPEVETGRLRGWGQPRKS